MLRWEFGHTPAPSRWESDCLSTSPRSSPRRGESSIAGESSGDRIDTVTIERKSAAAGEIEVGGTSRAEEDVVLCCALAFLEYISLYLDEEGWAPYKSEVSLELDGPPGAKTGAGPLSCRPT
jgi:hypothetical protein